MNAPVFVADERELVDSIVRGFWRWHFARRIGRIVVSVTLLNRRGAADALRIVAKTFLRDLWIASRHDVGEAQSLTAGGE